MPGGSARAQRINERLRDGFEATLVGFVCIMYQFATESPATAPVAERVARGSSAGRGKSSTGRHNTNKRRRR